VELSFRDDESQKLVMHVGSGLQVLPSQSVVLYTLALSRDLRRS